MALTKRYFAVLLIALAAKAATEKLPLQEVHRIVAVGDITIRGKRAKEIRYTSATPPSIVAANGQLVFYNPSPVTLELPREARNLSISSMSGFIDAADLAGPVRADTRAGRVILDRISGDVEIHSGGGPMLLGTIGGVARCYSGGGTIRAVNVKGGAYLQTDGGDINLGQVLGVVQAFTAAGGIHIDRAGSQVFADTFGGPIAILRALGAVVATSSGGPIDITDAPSVACRSASGTIRLNNVSGSLRAATDRGSIIAEILRGSPLRDSFLSTRGGDITVFVPSDMGVTIEAETNGTIVSDYSGLRIANNFSSVTGRGELNGGGPRLRLTDIGGRIEIKRK